MFAFADISIFYQENCSGKMNGIVLISKNSYALLLHEFHLILDGVR